MNDNGKMPYKLNKPTKLADYPTPVEPDPGVSMLSDELEKLVCEHNESYADVLRLRDELRQAQGALFTANARVVTYLFKNGMVEFLRVDWAKLHRARYPYGNRR